MERELTRLAIELELPASGGPVWFYPGATTRGGRDGLLLRVLDTDGDTRLCMVASNDDTPYSGPLEMPDNTHFYANGMLMSYDDPAVCEDVGVWPVVDGRWTPSNNIIVFHDHTAAVAFGPRGRAWASDRLVLDGLVVEDITEDVVRFVGYTFTDTDIAVKSHRVALSVTSGDVVDGKTFSGERPC
ncbi:MAG: hypothetical protein ACRCS9_13555 [Hyphomicrobium sp.]